MNMNMIINIYFTLRQIYIVPGQIHIAPGQIYNLMSDKYDYDYDNKYLINMNMNMIINIYLNIIEDWCPDRYILCPDRYCTWTDI